MTYLPTGNDCVALPDINAGTGGIGSVNVLHMGFRGLLEIGGHPLLAPFLRVNGVTVPPSGLAWERLRHWVPVATFAAGELQGRITYLAPLGQRGFVLHFALTAGTQRATVDWGWDCRWETTRHVINVAKDMQGLAAVITSPRWNLGPVLEFRGAVPLLALAPHGEDGTGGCATVTGEGALELRRQAELEPGGAAAFLVFWGVGLEEVGAVTAAREMQRTGWESLLGATMSWLSERIHRAEEPELDRLINLNLLFNRFYATGVTLDTEERVCVTSRSPRYYVSAAYWDRDTLLWSLPALTLCDPDCAREALDYVFRHQARNFGTHSRYIDGVVLEPGFELDELMAPLLAVESYVRTTGDRRIMDSAEVQAGLHRALGRVSGRRHPHVDLFETALLPTDDPAHYPFCTYDNVLVWRGLLAAGYLGLDPGGRLAALAGQVRQAIYDRCVVSGPAGPMFAWEVDLAGQHRLYDEPPGSLQLLPVLGFCAADDPIYRNTLAWIHSPANPHSFFGSRFAEVGCVHARHPWVLSFANSLRLPSRRAEAIKLLKAASLDSGIACESIDAESGECVTGAAFATCAGYLATSLWTALQIQ